MLAANFRQSKNIKLIMTELIEAYTRLKAFKEHLPQTSEIDVRYVREFHSILDLLTSCTGFDLKNFYIPSSDTRRGVTGGT